MKLLWLKSKPFVEDLVGAVCLFLLGWMGLFAVHIFS
jgi:hypothetical protein